MTEKLLNAGPALGFSFLSFAPCFPVVAVFFSFVWLGGFWRGACFLCPVFFSSSSSSLGQLLCMLSRNSFLIYVVIDTVRSDQSVNQKGCKQTAWSTHC